MTGRVRLDADLVRRGLARSRTQASRMIADGLVRVGGVDAPKPSTPVDAETPIDVRSAATYASRGAHKLIGALDAWPDLTVTGREALDAGASTGGFTDVLLRRGAARVIAADVGRGQLVPALAADPRVEVLDGVNVRGLRPDALPFRPDLVVADLSFISLTLVLPALVDSARPGADLVLMVKPQFEVGKQRLGSGGVVRDAALRAEAVLAVTDCAAGLGLGAHACVASPLPGPAGNVEYFVWFAPGAPGIGEDTVASIVNVGPK